MRIVTVDVDFSEHVKSEAILFLHSRLDFRIGSRFLARKLVAREGSDAKSLRLIFFVQSLKLIVVGVGQPSVGRHVYHHNHISFVFFSDNGWFLIDI